MTQPFGSAPEAATYLREKENLASDDVERVIDDVWRAQLSEAKPIEGAIECIESWAGAGAAICLISNIWRPYQVSAIDALGPRVQSIIPPERRLYSYALGVAKPASALFLDALRLSGCQPSEAVMVGDSYREDIAPAVALGLKTVWVLRRAEREIASLANVLNCDAAAPNAAVSAIKDFGVDKWRASLDDASQSGLRDARREN